VSEWEKAILEFLNKESVFDISIPKDLYSAVKWNEGMDMLIENAKKNIG
jgi:hypothetical protein